MKLFLLLLLILQISNNVLAAPNDDDIYYYFCALERSSDLKDPFKDEYVFHLKSSIDEDTEITKSKRWNLSTLTLLKNNVLSINIKEQHGGNWHVINEYIKLDGLSNINPIKVSKVYTLHVNEDSVTFNLKCE